MTDLSMVRYGISALIIVCALLGDYAMSDEVLVAFRKDFNLAAVETHDVKVSVSSTTSGAALHIES